MQVKQEKSGKRHNHEQSQVSAIYTMPWVATWMTLRILKLMKKFDI